MKLLVDGVFFQLAQSGIARVWSSLLPELAVMPDMEIVVLDRGGTPALPNLSRVPFPSYSLSRYTADDSIMIEKACKRWQADVFLSTYYTTPLETPSVAVVYDMIPEVLDFDLSVRDWMEKEVAISHARRHICISHQTRSDLLRLYKELDQNKVMVAYCGVDTGVFSVSPVVSTDDVCFRVRPRRDYFVLVGSRSQHNNYKNAKLFFDAVIDLENIDFDILCVGGEREIDDSIRTALQDRCEVSRVELSDLELAEVYRNAIALVYPSLYEGFGMPVIEAMACGCPVITTRHGALAESAGDAGLLVDGYSIAEMQDALKKVREPSTRASLVARGQAHVTKFRWKDFAETLADACHAVATENRKGSFIQFGQTWADLRKLQASVDIA